jgi:predicted ATPase/class 3 adenylate cyclase
VEDGTLTFLFTDLESSTRRWEEHPEAMSAALALHDALVPGAVAAHGGTVFKHTGDGFCAVFSTAGSALAGALAAQQAVAAQEWGEVGPLKVRMALHSGTAEHRDSDWFGPALNRTARLLATGHGGQVVVSLATAELAWDSLPPGAGLTDLGQHDLAGLSRPERVFQLRHPNLVDRFPPLRSTAPARHNLPAAASPFVGREDEVAELVGLLHTTRLLTLTGIGGTGKTRLALAGAAAASASFPDGVFVVELAPLSDPSLVVAQSLAALGVIADASDDAGGGIEQLRRYLAARRLLLIADNCEHLLDAVADLVQAVLDHCPGVSVLATSREALGLPAERVWRVPPLSPPDAVALLRERARTADPAFAVDAGNADALARIARRLDGLPLALELAAARLRVLSPGQVAERLDDRFRLLTGGSRTALPRHRTLRAAIDWSWDMLGPEERAVLRRLAVCAGTFDLNAAEAVAADRNQIATGDVLDCLTSLVDKSLVVVERATDEARYRLTETVRQYAADRMAEAGEAEATRDRHRDVFVAVVRGKPNPFSGPPSWYARLSADHDNFRAALEWCFARGATLTALRLAGSLAEFWASEGRLEEACGWLDRALTECPDAPVRTRGRVLCVFAFIRRQRGELPAARALVDEASALFHSVADQEGRLRVVVIKSEVVLQQGDVDDADLLCREGIALAESLGNPEGAAWCRFALGWVAVARGDRGAATVEFEAGLALFRASGPGDLTAAILAALAPLVAAGGDIARADALMDEAITTSRALGPMHQVMALTRAGEVGVILGDWPRAAEALAESLVLLRDLGGRAWTADSLELAAVVTLGRGRPGPAARLLGTAGCVRAALGETNRVRLVRAQIDRARAEAAEALGPEVFADETARGRALGPEAALVYALAQVEQ